MASRTMTPPGIHAANIKATDPTASAVSLVKNAGTDGVADNDGRRRPNIEATYQLRGARRSAAAGPAEVIGRAQSLLSSISPVYRSGPS